MRNSRLTAASRTADDAAPLDSLVVDRLGWLGSIALGPVRGAHLLPAFGHLRLDQITARVIDRYIAAKTRPADAPRRRPGKLGEALAPGSVANHIAVLRRVLSVARRWELLDRVPTIVCPPVWDQRFDFLTFEDRALPRGPTSRSRG